MKPLIFLFASSLILFACSKEDTPQPTSVDYSIYKIKTATNKRTNYSTSGISYSFDTSLYTYSGSNVSYQSRRPTTIWNNNYTLSNNLYTQEQYNNAVLSSTKSYYQLNSSGYIDTFWTISNSTVLQSGRMWFNSDGTITKDVYHYQGYDTEEWYSYNNGNWSSVVSVRKSFSPSVSNGKDSLVYEYYPNLRYHADFYSAGLPPSKYNKPLKNLIKKVTVYDLLNNQAIRQTREYTYETDAIGLVTKRMQTFYVQPGNVPGLSDTTHYTYYNR